jgi:chorismate mutase
MKTLSFVLFATTAIFAISPANAVRYVQLSGVSGPVPVLQDEPQPGTLRNGQKVLVINTRNGCPPSYALLLTGAPSLGTPRGRECIDRSRLER